MREQQFSKWHGKWKDDRNRFIAIEPFETPEGLATGYFMGVGDPQLYRDGNHVLDGSKLMERKRGEEAGWPI